MRDEPKMEIVARRICALCTQQWRSTLFSFFFFLHFLMRGLSEGIVNRGTFVRRDRRIFNLLKSKISIINSRHTSTILHSNYVSNSQKSSLPFQLPYSSSILILDDLKPFQTISNHLKHSLPSDPLPSNLRTRHLPLS